MMKMVLRLKVQQLSDPPKHEVADLSLVSLVVVVVGLVLVVVVVLLLLVGNSDLVVGDSDRNEDLVDSVDQPLVYLFLLRLKQMHSETSLEVTFFVSVVICYFQMTVIFLWV